MSKLVTANMTEKNNNTVDGQNAETIIVKEVLHIQIATTKLQWFNPKRSDRMVYHVY
jgi:hypothetical protein